MKLPRIAFALAILGLSAAARADATLYYDMTVSMPYQSSVSIDGGASTKADVTTGAYTAYKDVGTDPMTQFIAYCFQPTQDVSSDMWAVGANYADKMGTGIVYNSSNALTQPDSTTNFLSLAKTTAIHKLFDAYYTASLSNDSTKAAFQLALWEVTTDTADSGPSSYGLTTGNFRATVTGGGDTAAVTAQATTYLSDFQARATSGSWILSQWVSAGSQDFIAADTFVPPVPEPAPYLLVALGLGGLAAARRKQA